MTASSLGLRSHQNASKVMIQIQQPKVEECDRLKWSCGRGATVQTDGWVDAADRVGVAALEVLCRVANANQMTLMQ